MKITADAVSEIRARMDEIRKDAERLVEPFSALSVRPRGGAIDELRERLNEVERLASAAECDLHALLDQDQPRAMSRKYSPRGTLYLIPAKVAELRRLFAELDPLLTAADTAARDALEITPREDDEKETP